MKNNSNLAYMMSVLIPWKCINNGLLRIWITIELMFRRFTLYRLFQSLPTWAIKIEWNERSKIKSFVFLRTITIFSSLSLSLLLLQAMSLYKSPFDVLKWRLRPTRIIKSNSLKYPQWLALCNYLTPPKAPPLPLSPTHIHSNKFYLWMCVYIATTLCKAN